MTTISRETFLKGGYGLPSIALYKTSFWQPHRVMRYAILSGNTYNSQPIWRLSEAQLPAVHLKTLSWSSTCGAYGNTSFEIGAGRYFYVNANVIHIMINQYGGYRKHQLPAVHLKSLPWSSTCGAYGNTSFEIGASRYFYVNVNV